MVVVILRLLVCCLGLTHAVVLPMCSLDGNDEMSREKGAAGGCAGPECRLLEGPLGLQIDFS